MAEEAEPSLVGFTKTYLPVFSDDARRKVVYRIAKEEEEAPKKRNPAVSRVLPEEMERAIANLPSPVSEIIASISLDPQTNYGITEAIRRWAEFGSPEKAILVGAYLDPASRRRMAELLDREWAESRSRMAETSWGAEIVIGSGLHAAVYSAVRAKMGFPPPLVLEARDRVGGSFALGAASFYLNSRNRPGPLSIPGERGALNVIPGSLIQPSDLGGEEYQTNEVMAWAIRNTLAMHARVVPTAKVRAIAQIAGTETIEVGLEDGGKVRTRRVIVATGIGLPRNSTLLENDRIICFDKFMQMLGDPFPLRGMRRVAVLGGGDGGKTAIEALTGQGPNAMSVASVDWPEMIDWYGAPWDDCKDCTDNARIRYKRMASLLPDPQRPLRPYRVRPMNTAEAISAGFQVVYVNQMPYDYLIDCTGYVPNTLLPVQDESPPLAVVNEIRVGTRLGEEIYVIGPAANLIVGDNEKEVLRNIDENKTSMFRYAPRTAALAASLN